MLLNPRTILLAYLRQTANQWPSTVKIWVWSEHNSQFNENLLNVEVE